MIVNDAKPHETYASGSIRNFRSFGKLVCLQMGNVNIIVNLKGLFGCLFVGFFRIHFVECAQELCNLVSPTPFLLRKTEKSVILLCCWYSTHSHEGLCFLIFNAYDNGIHYLHICVWLSKRLFRHPLSGKPHQFSWYRILCRVRFPAG